MSDKPTKRMTKRDLAHMSKIATRDPAHRELIESAVSEIKILSGTLVRCQSLAIRIGWLESKPQDIVKTARRLQDEFIKAPYPASTWIGVTELVIPGARAEVKVTARIPS